MAETHIRFGSQPMWSWRRRRDAPTGEAHRGMPRGTGLLIQRVAVVAVAVAVGTWRREQLGDGVVAPERDLRPSHAERVSDWSDKRDSCLEVCERFCVTPASAFAFVQKQLAFGQVSRSSWWSAGKLQLLAQFQAELHECARRGQTGTIQIVRTCVVCHQKSIRFECGGYSVRARSLRDRLIRIPEGALLAEGLNRQCEACHP